jgi:hypothetical protein
MTKYHSNKKSTWKHNNKLIYLVCLAAKSGTFGVEILQHMYHWVDVTLPMEDDIKLFRRKETNFVKEFGVHVWLFWYEFESILYTLIIHWSITRTSFVWVCKCDDSMNFAGMIFVTLSKVVQIIDH